MSDPLFTSDTGAAAQLPPVEAVAERPVHQAPAAVAQPKGQGSSSGCLPLILTAIVAAVAATVVSATVSTAVLFFGSFSGGSLGDIGRSTQQGDIVIGRGDKLEVFYATPYERPPNLQLQTANGDWGAAVLLEEQKPDHFTVKSKRFPQEGVADKIHWRAEGSLKSK